MPILRLLRNVALSARNLFFLAMMAIFVTVNCMAMSGSFVYNVLLSDSPRAAEAVVEAPVSTVRTPPGLSRAEPEPSSKLGSVVALTGAFTVFVIAGGFALFSVVGGSKEEDA